MPVATFKIGVRQLNLVCCIIITSDDVQNGRNLYFLQEARLNLQGWELEETFTRDSNTDAEPVTNKHKTHNTISVTSESRATHQVSYHPA